MARDIEITYPWVTSPDDIEITYPWVSLPGEIHKEDMTFPTVSAVVELSLRDKKGNQIIFPWNPDKITYRSGEAQVATHDILKKGPVDVQLGQGLKEAEWEGIFPGLKRTDTSMLHGGERKAPKYYKEMLEYWKSNGTTLTFLVTNYPVNFDCYIKDFYGDLTGGFGDIEYSIHLVEQQDINIIVSKEESQEGGTTEGEDTKRPAEKKETYTIKSGDDMWTLSYKFLGDGGRWKELYEANKAVLDKKAAEMGHPNNDGSWIFPGTTITIPQS